MRMPHSPPVSRLLFLSVAALWMLAVSGCTPTNLFYGRLIIINTTGGVLRSPVVGNQVGLGDDRIALPDMTDGQAWIRDFGHKTQMVILGPLELSYVDRTGITQTRTVPFSSVIPQPCDEDFFIEIDHNDQLHSGILVYGKGDYIIAIATHTLAVTFGLSLGWLFWHRNRQPGTLPIRAEKPIIMPDLG